MKNILIALMNSLKAPLLKILETEVVKIALANLIQAPWLLDFRTWAVKFAVDYLIQDIAKPIIDYFFQKVGYEYEVMDGEHLLKKIQNSANATEWEHNAHSV
jgi:hypothetical protein